MSKPRRFTFQLVGGLVAILVLFVGGGVFAMQLMATAMDRRDETLRHHVMDLVYAERLSGATERTVAIGRGYLLTGDADFVPRLAEAQVELESLLAQLRARARDPDEERLGKAVSAAADRYILELDRLVRARPTNASAPVVGDFERRVLPRREALRNAIGAFLDHKERGVEQGRHDARRDGFEALAASAGALGAAVIFAGALAFFFGRRLADAYRREQHALGRAQQAVTARQDLLGMVAHDLRNPLAAIALKAQQLKRVVAPDRCRVYAEGIEEGAKRMDGLISSLLDAASIESGRFSVRLQRCAASQVLSDASDVAATLAADKGIVLELRDGAVGVEVNADAARLVQVLLNLVGNAIKFTPRGGRITISAEGDGASARFSVTDTGPGIPADQQQYVFERFWTREREGQLGTGLGLYVSRGVVEAHGGAIGLSSREGHGATFWFTIPAVAASPMLAGVPGTGSFAQSINAPLSGTGSPRKAHEFDPDQSGRP